MWVAIIHIHYVCMKTSYHFHSSLTNDCSLGICTFKPLIVTETANTYNHFLEEESVVEQILLKINNEWVMNKVKLHWIHFPLQAVERDLFYLRLGNMVKHMIYIIITEISKCAFVPNNTSLLLVQFSRYIEIWCFCPYFFH